MTGGFNIGRSRQPFDQYDDPKNPMDSKDKYDKVQGIVQKTLSGKKAFNSIYDSWEYTAKQKQLKLVYFLLLFAYYHDDDEFSKEEQKTFKKLLKKDHDYLSTEDVKEVLDTIQDAKSVGDLHVFISTHQYTKDMIQDAVTTVKKYANYQQRYLSIITQVIDSYQP